MISDNKTAKQLGVAYLIQFVASLASGQLADAAIGSGTISESLVSISNNVLLMRISILTTLITSLGIITMTVLLYFVLQKENKVIALVALSFWVTEAVLLAISTIGSNTLRPLSFEYVQAGSPSTSPLLTLGTLFLSFQEFTYTIHMLFFALGGIMWYFLFYKSKKIPKFLSLWGLVLLSLMPIDIILALFGFGIDSILRMIALVPLIPYLPFEGVMGLWLIIKGLNDN